MNALAGLYCIANASTLTHDVAAEMARCGMAPMDANDIRTDGVLGRFDCMGDKRGKKNGWCVVFAEGARPVATFGHWAKGITETVVLGKPPMPMSAADKARAAMAMDAARREREADTARKREHARKEANALWQGSLPASPHHPYLIRKGIGPEGLRAAGSALLVPMRDDAGRLHNVQKIQANGIKRFLTGGRVRECYASIGRPGNHFLLCEGWATGASLHAATGLPVAVCFSAGNLAHVGRLLRAKYPDARLTFCADNDAKPDGRNVGLEAATEAAGLVGGFVATPPIPGDFNDYITGDAGANLHEVIHA